MRTKIIVIVLLLALIVPALYTQVLKPITIQAKKVQCVSWDATYVGIENQAKEIINDSYNKNEVFIHSFKDKLPSSNPNDYMTMYCTLEIKNRSVFHMNSVEAFVWGLGDYSEKVLFSYSSSEVVTSGVWRLSSGEITFRLDLFIANMDETAIRNLVKGIKSKVISEGDFIGIREEIIDFSNCKNVTVEFGK